MRRPEAESSSTRFSATASNEAVPSLLSRYSNAVKLILGGGALAVGIAAAGSTYNKADKPSTSELMYRELAVQMIESGKWSDVRYGVVWAIEQMAKNAKGNDRGSEQAAYEAMLRENFILGYHKIGITPGKNKEFPLYYDFTPENLLIFGELYENVLDLYLMRNPSEKREDSKIWKQEGKIIQISFAPDIEKGRYYIRRIDLVEASQAQSE